MGCDIHLFRERRIDGIWETDTTRECEPEEQQAEDPYYSYESGMGYFGRSYLLFAALSGVRSYGPMAIDPPAEDRGFPEDACEMNKACSDQWDADGHSHGWLDMRELSELMEKYFQAPVLHDGNAERFEMVLANLEELKTQAEQGDYFKGLAPEDCRILFLYDN